MIYLCLIELIKKSVLRKLIEILLSLWLYCNNWGMRDYKIGYKKVCYSKLPRALFKLSELIKLELCVELLIFDWIDI
jgi:hypothetical protein